ncbi:MAG TPA: YfhO family protein [Thermoanaerobaculia bacterium]|nr:YfhO family protein [Thermoanaerobaculia bacterium]
MNPTFAYLALVYALAVFAGRRLGAPLPWKIAFFFYLLALLFLFQPLVLPYVSGPLDYIFTLPPWRDSRAPLNGELNDIPLQVVPWTHLVRESWKDLTPPLWNASAGAGYPLLANGQSSGLSILHLITLPLPLAESISCEAALKILIALTFAFLFMRRRGFSEEAATLTAVAFGFSSFLMVWLHFPMVSVAALLPATFYAIDLLLESVTAARVALCTAVMSALLLNGHPETAAHIIFASGSYVLFCLIAERTRKVAVGIAGVIAAGLMAVLIALPFILPLLESLPRSKRIEVLKNAPTQITRMDANALITFYQNQYFGTFREHNLWGPGIAEFASGSAGILGFAAWLTLLIDLVRRRAWRERGTFFVLFAPLVVAIAMGWPVVSDLFHRLPLFSLAANGRLRLVFCWLAAVMAGLIVERGIIEQRRSLLLLTSLTGFLLIAAAFLMSRPPEGNSFEHARNTSILPMTLLVVCGFFGLRSHVRPSVAAALLVALTGAELWSFGYHWNTVIPRSDFYPRTPMIRFLEQKRDAGRVTGSIFRIAGSGAMFFPNVSAIFGLEDIRAHDPMAHGRYLGALRVLTGYSSAEYFAMLSKFDHPFLDYMNVRYILTGPGQDLSSSRLKQVYSGKDGRVFENLKAVSRFFAADHAINEFNDAKRMDGIMTNQDWSRTVLVKRFPDSLFDTIRPDVLEDRTEGRTLASVRVTQARPSEYKLAINAPRWTLIASSVPAYPGWRIRRNGSEAVKMIEINDLFIGFLVPPGKSDILLIYHPRSFYAGAWISLTTILLLCAAVARARVQRLRTRPHVPAGDQRELRA